MTCQHDYIITFRTPDGQPVMWACSDCKLKFVPFNQMLTEVAEEREACARLCDEFGFVWPSVAVAIRARGEACSSAVKESLITAEHDKPFNFAKQCDIDGLKETYITAMRRAENALQRLKEMGEDINDIRARGEI